MKYDRTKSGQVGNQENVEKDQKASNSEEDDPIAPKRTSIGHLNEFIYFQNQSQMLKEEQNLYRVLDDSFGVLDVRLFTSPFDHSSFQQA